MAAPISYCVTCRSVFPAPGTDILPGSAKISKATFTGCTVNCPKGHDAVLLDGTFDFVGDTVMFVSGPEFTKQVFERLFKLIEESSPNATAGDIANKAADIHPKAGKLIEKISGGDLNKRGGVMKATFAAVIAALAATKCSVNFDVNKFIDQMHLSSPAESQAPSPHKK